MKHLTSSGHSAGADTVKTEQAYNNQMCILSVIGICFVVLGHLVNDSTSIGTLSGWFPYYSFHLPLFLFISGYFFKDISRPFFRSFGVFFLKKAKNLMLPFYVINALMILFRLALKPAGFSTWTPYTPVRFLLMPFVSTQPDTMAIPTWYLAALFISELLFVLIRKLFTLVLKKDLIRDLVLLVFLAAAGIVALYIRKHFDLSDTVIVYLRSVVMLFYLQTGLFYRKYLEKYDRLPGIWYFTILLAVQGLIILLSRNNFLGPGLYNLSLWELSALFFYPAGLTGIFLYLRIARLLSLIPGKSRLILFIGKHTKYIMAFHLSGFFLVNLVLYLLNQNHLAPAFTKGFDTKLFFTDKYYANLENPRLLIFYFTAGMGVSLLIAKLVDLIKHAFKKQLSLHRSARRQDTAP